MINKNFENIIREAIKGKRAIELTYDKPGDYAKGLRIGNPHALYYTKSTNKTKLDVYQISGDSSSSIPNWKPFDIEYVKTIRIIDNQSFNVEPDYKPDSIRYIDSIIKI